jgi:hypothetical protein
MSIVALLFGGCLEIECSRYSEDIQAGNTLYIADMMLFEGEEEKKRGERELHLNRPKGVIRLSAKAVLSRPRIGEARALGMTVQKAEVRDPGDRVLDFKGLKEAKKPKWTF